MMPPILLARRIAEQLYRLVELGAAIDGQPRTFGTDTPLSRTEIHVVSEIATNQGIGTTELASRFGVTKGAISQTLQRLEAKDLIQREVVGRTVRLVVTDLGQRAHQEHLVFHATQERVIAAAYPDPETMARDLETIERMLAILTAFEA